MAKLKLKNKKKPVNVLKKDEPKKPRKDPRIQEVYEEEVEFICPVRGKVKQKVKIKRFKSLGDQAPRHQLLSNDSMDKLEENDDGLSIYSEGEELGVTSGPPETDE
jgi:hypothetical protein